MSKKVAVIVGGAGLGMALAKALAGNPYMVTTVDTGESTDGKLADALTGHEGDIMVIDEAGENLFYDPKVIDSLAASMSDRELYGIEFPDAMALVNDRKLGDYRLFEDLGIHNVIKNGLKVLVADEHYDFSDNFPQNTTKPKFLLERDHHIRKVRR